MAIAEIEVNALPAITAAEVERQLGRLLESHHFCHSHRYPVLLKYLVEQTQAGKGASLKERLLGIEVFHRAPDYDTNTDPVVRVTAAEVRKRIAQYYQEPEHRDELRIDLPTGSYVPRFFRAGLAPEGEQALRRKGKAAAVNDAEAAQPAPAAEDNEAAMVQGAAAAAVVPPTADRRHGTGWPGLLAACGLGMLLVLAAIQAARLVDFWQERAVRDFWAPMASPGVPLFMVIGDHTVGSPGNALRADQGAAINPTEAVLQLMNEHEQITLSDTTSLFRVVDYMVRHRLNYTAAGAGSVSLDDLRNGPVLLFAGLDNRWTLRLSQHLRYRFLDSPDDSVGVIVDSRDSARRWSVDFKVPYTKMPADYAIVARFQDSLLEEPVVIVAGLGETGTVSASEFVTSERMMEDLARMSPHGLAKGNVEAVLAAPVIDGRPGPAHIVEAQFW